MITEISATAFEFKRIQISTFRLTSLVAPLSVDFTLRKLLSLLPATAPAAPRPALGTGRAFFGAGDFRSRGR